MDFLHNGALQPVDQEPICLYTFSYNEGGRNGCFMVTQTP